MGDESGFERRKDDRRIAKLISDTETLQRQHSELSKKLDKNTALTQEIRDLLKAFKLLGAIAKWITVVVTAGTVLYHLLADPIVKLLSK